MKQKFKQIFILLSILILLYLLYEDRKVNKIILPYKDGGDILFGIPKIKDSNVKNIYNIGFAVGYDLDKKSALWVSYNLRKDFYNGKKYLKKRIFQKDYRINTKFSTKLADYKYSGFDRGHLVRQGDLKGRSYKCELEGCYLTNIVPQLPDFNRIYWLNLENAVSGWACDYDELWVVAGPIYDDDVQFIKKGSDVDLPDYFYKIVVARDGDSYLATAYLLNHFTESLDLSDFIVSIDSVEALAGIDFFHTLNDSIENFFEKEKGKVWRRNN